MFTIRRSMAGFVPIDAAPGAASLEALFYLRRSATVIYFTASGVRLWSSKTADGSQSARRQSPWDTGIEFQDEIE